MELMKIYETIVGNMEDGVYFVDTKRKILFWNAAAEKITGYKSEEIVGKHCDESKLNHIDERGTPLCLLGCPLYATNIDGKIRRERVFVRHKNGYRVPVVVNIFPIIENGTILGSIEIFTLDSPVKYNDNLVEKLSGIAMHDELTHLPNRRYFENFLNYKHSEYNKFGNLYCVLFADIDDFRKFNNTYGHEAGDIVLANIGETFLKSTGKNDILARFGGEEFVGVFSINSEYEATIKAEQIRKLVESTEISYNGVTLNVSISVGMTVVREDDTPEKIIKRADMLMYESKKNNKNRVTVG